MKKFSSKNQKIGETGENLAEMFLVKHGYTVLERNYTVLYGEIDIICIKDGTLHFIEVKSVSRENIHDNVSHETNGIQPEENMHYKKIQKLHKTIEIYLEKNSVSHETPWKLDLVCVYLNHKIKKGKVKLIKNII